MVRIQEPVSAAGRPIASISLSGVVKGMRRLIPVAVFVIPFGIAFGVAAIDRGMSPTQAVAMSALVFSGTAQFASLDFWHEPVAFLSLGLVVLALNGRHIIMSAALSPWVNRLPFSRRLAVLSLLSDANFADTHGALKEGAYDLGPLLGGGIVLWATWVTETTVGVLGGSLLGHPETYGIDVVMVCFFTAVVAGHLRKVSNIMPVIVAGTVAALTLEWLPLGWNIILAALAGALTSVFRNAR